MRYATTLKNSSLFITHVHLSSRFHNEPYIEIKSRTITLDKMIEQYGTPDLIKIDVEGGEYECISSLSQKVDTLCFEWASEVNDITFKCLDHLTSLGFTKFYIQKGDTYNFRPQDNDFYDVSTTIQLLRNMIPKEDWGMIWCK